jgi:hypothetical protein
MPGGGPYTIYSDTVNAYQASGVGLTWSNLRDGGSGVVTAVGVNPTTARHLISEGGGNYTFIRTYIQFDISSVTEPITSIQLYLQGTTGYTPGDTTYVAYAGSKNALSNNANDYPLYIAEATAGGGVEISTIVLQGNQYVSCDIDITAYPIYGDHPTTPAYQYYNVALVANDDFLNNINGTFADTRINNESGRYPYLVINGGYANNVIGVPGANITTVSGVPSANITNIMGV